MCGISGYFGQNPESKTRFVEAMLKVMNHRGPDHSGVMQHNNAVIGFNRLAINDLHDTGNQPFQTGSTIVYCNGEIYNHRELKKRYGLLGKCRSQTDIEVAPHLYEQLGWDFLQELNGMFAMVLIEESARKLHLITDRFGKKPMYFYQTDEGVFFASELKAFLMNFDCHLNVRAINAGFFLGYFPYSMTPVKDVFKIPPATIFTICDRLVSQKQWYILTPKVHPSNSSPEYYQDLYDNLLDDSVKLRMEADVDVGVYLSGGLDSTSIAKSCSLQGYKNIHAFCGVISGKEDSTDNINSMRFAEENGLILHQISLDDKTYNQLMPKTCATFDEINFESANLNFITISREARKYVKVLLDGIGGDEVFFGYPSQKSFSKIPKILRGSVPMNGRLLIQLDRLSSKSAAILHVLMDPKTWFFFRRTFIPIRMMTESPNFDFEWLYNSLSAEIDKYCHGFDSPCDMNLLSYLDILGYDMLNYQHTDRCSMAYSIEPRSPLSDYRIWEAFLSVNESVKLKRGLKTLMKQLSGHRLPDYILQATKDGFSSPLAKWFVNNSKLRKTVLCLIEKKFELLESILGASLIKQILSPWQDCKNIQWMDGIRLHQLLSFVLWYRIYFENKALFDIDAPLESIL